MAVSARSTSKILILRRTLLALRSVLVTGASGVIGRATTAALLAAGYEVRAVSSLDGDLRDARAANELIAAVAPDAIIHLAGRVHGLMGNASAQGDMYLDNILINTHVVEAARKAGVQKIVAMGSVAVYGDSIQLPMREADLWQGAPHASEIGYAQAKRSMLAHLEANRDQYGLEFAFAVSTNLFGPHDRFDELRGHVLPSLISKFQRAVSENSPVTVWGTGTATRDFLYSVDAAEALVTLLASGDGVYNVASGHHVTIRELATEIAQVAKFTGEIMWDRSKPDGQAARAYDITRLASLGWAPQVPLSTALAETYDWYCSHVNQVRR